MPGRRYKVPGGQRSLLNNRADIKGVYGGFPAASPKYNTNNTTESVNSQARMFIEVSSPEAFGAYVNSIQGNKRAQELARVLAAGNTSNKFTSEATPGLGYVDFILTSFSEQNQELNQVVEVLADAYVHYCFGQVAPRVNLSGWVYNTRQDNWYDAFHILYQELIRGTKLATRKQILILRIDTRLYYCTPVSNSLQFTSDLEMAAQFQMQVIVKRITFLDRKYDNQKPTNLRQLGITSLFSDVVGSSLNNALQVFQVQREEEDADTADEIEFTEEDVLEDQINDFLFGESSGPVAIDPEP